MNINKYLNYLKFFIYKHKLILIGFVLAGIVLILNIVFFWDLRLNYLFYFEYRDHVNCSIEPYKLLKTLKIFRNSFIVFSILFGTMWLVINKSSSDNPNRFLPIRPSVYSLSKFIFEIVFHLCTGLLILLFFYLELNFFIKNEEWKLIPFTLIELIPQLLIDILIFSIINSLSLFIFHYLMNNYLIFFLIGIVIYLGFIKNILPGQGLIENLTQICPPIEL